MSWKYFTLWVFGMTSWQYFCTLRNVNMAISQSCFSCYCLGLITIAIKEVREVVFRRSWSSSAKPQCLSGLRLVSTCITKLAFNTTYLLWSRGLHFSVYLHRLATGGPFWKKKMLFYYIEFLLLEIIIGEIYIQVDQSWQW